MSKKILELATLAQSLTIADFAFKKAKKKEKKTEDFVESAVGINVGAALQKETADVIASL